MGDASRVSEASPLRRLQYAPKTHLTLTLGVGGCLCTSGLCFVWVFSRQKYFPWVSSTVAVPVLVQSALHTHFRAVWAGATHGETAPPAANSLIILERFSITCLIAAAYALPLGEGLPAESPSTATVKITQLEAGSGLPPLAPSNLFTSHYRDLALCNVSSLHQLKTSDPKSTRDFGFPIWQGDLLPTRSTWIKIFF